MFMRKIQTYGLLIMVILSAFGSLSAQVNTLYFMKGVPQIYQVNPAIAARL